MPIKTKVGEIIEGSKGKYEIVREITEGNMAWALEAKDIDHGGKRIFLKYYKSPTPTVDWYNDYIAYVGEINRRLEENAAARYCVLSNDLFVANPRPSAEFCDAEFLFQAYDFIDSGYDMQKLLDEGKTSVQERLLVAKIFLVAMRKVHDAGVIHCDLKPENVQLVTNSNSKATQKLLPRMIDMDRSILEEIDAPWTKGSNREGYTGTPGYFSPEHLRGEKPQKASDVFTIGIILAELIGDGHPFRECSTDADALKAAVLGGKYRSVSLLPGLRISGVDYAKLIERCLSPDPSKRPTCAELHAALLEADCDTSAPVPTSHPSSEPQSAPTPTPTPSPSPEPAPAPAPTPVPKQEKQQATKRVVAIKLRGDAGEIIQHTSMVFGRYTLNAVSAQAERLCGSSQFRLDYEQDSCSWFISPIEGCTNLTGLNGAPLHEKTLLKEGDTICLIGKASGKKAMEITVSLVM